MKKTYKKIFWTILKIIATTIPLFLIFRQVDLLKLGPTLHKIQWWSIPVLLSTALISMILQGTRWWILIRAFTNKLSFVRSMGYHFSSSFYSMLIPNSLSLDVIRTVFASKQVGSIISWSSTWIAKILGIVVSFGFSVYGLILLSDPSIPQNIPVITGTLFVVLILLIILSFSKRCTRALRKVINPLIPKFFLSWIEDLREGIYQFRNKKSFLLIVFACTIIIQFVLIFGVTLLIYGITDKLYFTECMAFIPLIEMISMAQPFTPNGIGVREALIAIMFKMLGLTSEQLGIYIIISNLSILLKFLGVIPILFGFNRHTKQENFVDTNNNKITQ